MTLLVLIFEFIPTDFALTLMRRPILTAISFAFSESCKREGQDHLVDEDPPDTASLDLSCALHNRVDSIQDVSSMQHCLKSHCLDCIPGDQLTLPWYAMASYQFP